MIICLRAPSYLTRSSKYVVNEKKMGEREEDEYWVCSRVIFLYIYLHKVYTHIYIYIYDQALDVNVITVISMVME